MSCHIAYLLFIYQFSNVLCTAGVEGKVPIIITVKAQRESVRVKNNAQLGVEVLMENGPHVTLVPNFDVFSREMR